MTAMIQNDREKEWMLPLLELRDALDVADDRHLRDFRRMTGQVQLFHDRPIPGPYTQDARAEWLRRLFEAQRWIREEGPEEMRSLDLITQEEIREIRRIWVIEKKEIEDLVPTIFRNVFDVPYFDGPIDDQLVIRAGDLAVLAEVCDGDDGHYRLVRDLLEVERRFRSMARRAGLYEAMEDVFKKNFFDGEEDAVVRARRMLAIRENPLDAASAFPGAESGDLGAPA